MTNAKKTKKPLIEKQRRERMNKSLIQIKQLVLHATNKNEMNYMKMEKADILEMTVSFLKSLQNAQICPNHSSVSLNIVGHQNVHTFQEPTSTTLLSEDSPIRDDGKTSTNNPNNKKLKSNSPRNQTPSPSQSPVAIYNEHNNSYNFEHRFSNPHRGNQELVCLRTISGANNERNLESKRNNILLKKENFWRPW